jgi:hypothetical protein
MRKYCSSSVAAPHEFVPNATEQARAAWGGKRGSNKTVKLTGLHEGRRGAWLLQGGQRLFWRSTAQTGALLKYGNYDDSRYML